MQISFLTHTVSYNFWSNIIFFIQCVISRASIIDSLCIKEVKFILTMTLALQGNALYEPQWILIEASYSGFTRLLLQYREIRLCLLPFLYHDHVTQRDCWSPPLYTVYYTRVYESLSIARSIGGLLHCVFTRRYTLVCACITSICVVCRRGKRTIPAIVIFEWFFR